MPKKQRENDRKNWENYGWSLCGDFGGISSGILLEISDRNVEGLQRIKSGKTQTILGDLLKKYLKVLLNSHINILGKSLETTRETCVSTFKGIPGEIPDEVPKSFGPKQNSKKSTKDLLKQFPSAFVKDLLENFLKKKTRKKRNFRRNFCRGYF